MERRALGDLADVILILFLLLVGGCASTSRISPAALHPSYNISRDGGLQYRLPVGWFDASADSQAVGHAIWLMRADYGATIVVDEVRLARGAREEITSDGLLRLAELLISLTAGNQAAVLLEPPTLATRSGRTVCRYALLASESRDTLRVTLLDTGARIYTVTSLRSGPASGQQVPLAAVTEGFLETLRW